MKICIVGGGASGLLLASLLSNHQDVEVTILERYEHVGKKLLLTGNGRCNLTNINIKESCYNSNKTFSIAQSFDTVKYFNSLGLLTYQDDEGRVYPLSNTSNNVLDVLRNSIHATIKENFNVIRILKKDNQYEIVSDKNNKEYCDAVVLAMGGKTYYKENNGYLISSMLSCRITPLKPSLTSLKVLESLASIANLKVKAKASLFVNNNKVYEDHGEVLFKADALSGIVIFQLSSYMTRYPLGKYVITLDLMEKLSYEEVVDYVSKYPSLIGAFPKMIAKYIKDNAKSNEPKDIAYTIKNLAFTVNEPYDFKSAQVTAGGVSYKDLNDSLENKYNQNCYIIGEMLDADGICGGYNLQFAFASAYVAYKNILDKVGKNNEE